MKSSVWLLGVMLVSPAWSQEPVTNTPVLTPLSFDRSSDSIRKIVRDAAATQSVPVQLSEETPVKRESDAAFIYVPPAEAPPPVKTPTPRLPVAEPESNGLLSAVFGMLIDDLLDVEPDDPAAGLWVTCEEQGAMQRIETCPARVLPQKP